MALCPLEVKLVNKAYNIRIPGPSPHNLAELKLPEHMTLSHKSHDTGIQTTLSVQVPGEFTVPVWVGSIWHSSSHEHNDRDKVAGMQRGYEFLKSVVDAYFSALEQGILEYDEAKAEESRAFAERLRVAEQTRVDTIKQLFGIAE